MKPKILIGIPTMGSVHTFLMVTIMKWVVGAKENGYYISLYPTMSVQPVDNARNEIVDEFLKSDCTHLLFIDSDTIPPEDTIVKMLKVDADIVSGITPIIELDEMRINESSGFYKRSNVIGIDGKSVQVDTGIVDVKTAGGSCLLIKRAVIEKLTKPIFRFIYKDCHPDGIEFNGKAKMMSEDYYFCAKALDAGFTIKCDSSIICRHQKSILW